MLIWAEALHSHDQQSHECPDDFIGEAWELSDIEAHHGKELPPRLPLINTKICK